MRRFSFRLQPFLKLREYRERGWKLKMAEASGRVIELENRLDGVRHDRGASFGVPAGSTGRKLDMNDLMARQRYIARLDRDSRQLQESLEARREERDEVRQQLNEAMKQRKVLDALRDRRAEEYYAEARRGESKQLDDLATSKSAHDYVTREHSDVEL